MITITHMLSVMTFVSATSFVGDWSDSTPQELIQLIAENGARIRSLEAFELVTEIESFRSASDVVPFDTERSVMICAGNRYRVDAMGLTTIQDERHLVTIDSAERMVIVGNVGPVVNEASKELMRTVLENAVGVGRRKIGGSVEYRVEFLPKAQYSAMHLVFDQEGYLMSTTSYWRFAIKEDPDDPNSAAYKPKLLVRYGRPRNVQTSVIEKKLRIEGYVRFVDEEPMLAPGWDGFTIHDSRLR